MFVLEFYEGFYKYSQIKEESNGRGRPKEHKLKVRTDNKEISKLWWIGKLTYDEKRSDPFELTEFLRYDFATRTLVLFSSNYTNNPRIVRALLSAMKDMEENGMDISRSIFVGVTKYLNVLGGTYILDYFEEDELKEKIIKEIKKLYLLYK